MNAWGGGWPSPHESYAAQKSRVRSRYRSSTSGYHIVHGKLCGILNHACLLSFVYIWIPEYGYAIWYWYRIRICVYTWPEIRSQNEQWAIRWFTSVGRISSNTMMVRLVAMCENATIYNILRGSHRVSEADEYSSGTFLKIIKCRMLDNKMDRVRYQLQLDHSYPIENNKTLACNILDAKILANCNSTSFWLSHFFG